MRANDVFVYTVDTFPYRAQKHDGCYSKGNFRRLLGCENLTGDDIIKVVRSPRSVQLRFMEAETYRLMAAVTWTLSFVAPREKKVKCPHTKQQMSLCGVAS